MYIGMQYIMLQINGKRSVNGEKSCALDLAFTPDQWRNCPWMLGLLPFLVDTYAHGVRGSGLQYYLLAFL